jgi:hypothetical protein
LADWCEPAQGDAEANNAPEATRESSRLSAAVRIQKETRTLKTKTGIAFLVALGLSGSARAGQDNTNQAPKELRLELKLIDGSRTIVRSNHRIGAHTDVICQDGRASETGPCHQGRLEPRNGVHRPVQRRQAHGRRQPCAHQAADDLRGRGDQHRARQGVSRPVDQTPSLPGARPRSDRPRCGGGESEFLAVVGWASCRR